jgi:hypothetical protein
MTPISRSEVIRRLTKVFPEGTVLEYASGVRRMVVGIDRRTGYIDTVTLPHPDGTMPKGQRRVTTSPNRVMEHLEL